MKHSPNQSPLSIAGTAVSRAGRHGDDVAVHMSRDELDLLRSQWGEPTIHPETGLPEYWKFGSILKALAPAAAAFVAPWAAPAIGGALGASATWAPVLGSSLLGAGAGAISGGGRGALLGGITGGALSAIAPVLGNTFANIAPQTAREYFGITGGSDSIFGSGASLWGPPAASATPPLQVGTATPAMHAAASSPPGTTVHAGAGPQQGSWLSSNWGPVALGSLGLAALGGGADETPEHKPAGPVDQGPYAQPLNLTDRRKQLPVEMDIPSWYTYGSRPERQFFSQNAVPRAQGGPIQGRGEFISPSISQNGPAYVGSRGEGGQDDTVPAMLSDGEYVIDATTVADLGDGNSDAGAKKLDRMRDKIAKHKGRKERVPPKSKSSALKYLRSVG